MAADGARWVPALPAAAPPFLPSGEGKGPTSGYKWPKESTASDVTAPAAEHAGTCSPSESASVPARPGSPGRGQHRTPAFHLGEAAWRPAAPGAGIAALLPPDPLSSSGTAEVTLHPAPSPPSFTGRGPASPVPAATEPARSRAPSLGRRGGPAARPDDAREGDAGRAAPRSVCLRGPRPPLFRLPQGARRPAARAGGTPCERRPSRGAAGRTATRRGHGRK